MVSKLISVTLVTNEGTTWSTSINPLVTIQELADYFFAETGFNSLATYSEEDGDKIELIKTITITKETK